ncbi:glutathione S-transferase family protein [Marinobacter gelidimuriae]|uniref:glutathione S-transferase family protein n=1 Tax=Marinobacter gelidimuriae TaxID=2739064 RepID=UPI000372CFA6|nr:glutathione S-transferase family protein [Marinobacter gelidimuriae]
MPTLWGRATSSNVQKVQWLCAEMALYVERIDIGGKFGNTDTAAFRSKNPNGLIPIFEDNALVLWESNAILRYLAVNCANQAFYPAEPTTRGLVDQWMDWQLGTLWPCMRPYFISLALTPEKERDHNATDAARDKTFALWSILEGSLVSSDWIVGHAPSLADIALGPFLHRWFTLNPAALNQQPRLRELYHRLSERPAYQQHIMAQPFR